MAVLIVGVSETGVSNLPPSLQDRIAAADHIIAAPRFHKGLPDGPKVEAWPTPFSDVFARIDALRDRQLVIVATGDPMWYGVGATIQRRLGAGACEVIPAVSGFQMAATRMGWPLANCETLSIHGRPARSILPRLYPRAKLLLLAENSRSAGEIAALLTDAGYGAARLSALAHIGGDEEARFDGVVSSWDHTDIPDFHILAVDCADCHNPADGFALPDNAFVSSGKMTKRDARASALAKLAPFPGAVFWDVGCGSGAVAVDFLRQAPRGSAFAIDRDANQIDMAKQNAVALGVPHLQTIHGDLPEALANLPQPDAVFIGGGLSADLVTRVYEALQPGGVMVAHCVTIESETLLTSMWQKFGGNLARLSVHHADPVGGFHGWRPLMPVTQWHLVKPVGNAT